MGSNTFALKPGNNLPNGLVLTGATGAITGTPLAAGVTTFNIMVTDCLLSSFEKPLTITIHAPMPAAPPAPATSKALADLKAGFQWVGIRCQKAWAAAVAAPVAARTWNDARSMFYSVLVLYIVLAYVNLLRDINDNTRFCYLPGSVSVFFLLGGITVILGRLGFIRGTARVALIFGVIAFYGFSYGWQRNPHRLEELEELGYYDRKPCLLPLDKIASETDRSRMPQLHQYASYRNRHVEGLIVDRRGSASALTVWAEQVTKENRRPPLIIITTSGGASGSAQFTLKVLTALESRHPGFSRYVRIVTGASGGMVGAAYFRSQLPQLPHYRDPQERDKEEGAVAAQMTELFTPMNARMKRDFLSPIAQEWTFKDLPVSFSPKSYSSDRGQRLQQVWKKELDGALEVTFETLAEQERKFALPTLIFSPLLIEDGRQLLISTLDLDHLVAPEPYVTREDSSVRRLSAIEFFKLFPDALPKLKLASAARLNATFAWLSPSVTIPTVPPRQVVDAGYLDNHGIMTAMMWLYYHRDWIVNNTSRVILLNIRVWDIFEEKGLPPVTGPELARIHQLKSPDCWPRPAFSLAEFTTPLTGLENARSFGAVYRNDRAIEGMTELLSYFTNYDGLRAALGLAATVTSPLLKTDRFQGLERYTIIGDISDLPLNWTLSRRQADQLDERVDAAMTMVQNETVPLKAANANEWNAQQFKQLLDHLGK